MEFINIPGDRTRTNTLKFGNRQGSVDIQTPMTLLRDSPEHKKSSNKVMVYPDNASSVRSRDNNNDIAPVVFEQSN